MLLFSNVRTTYLKAYKKRIVLQLSDLPNSTFLTEIEKQDIETIYKKAIVILDEVITARIEVIAPEIIK